jgi:hypothetical protein
MKKTLLSFAALFAAASLQAQVVTFDSFPLAPESHNDESDDNGVIQAGPVTFFTEYDTQYDYWSSGWTYSNMTDVTTAGYANQWSSYAGGGATGSSNFGIYYAGYLGTRASIDFGSPTAVASMNVTNNTYAALSMLNGDSYGKQFGSPNNANGTPDGTNGEDFLRLLVIGLDADSVITDTVVFYLADYRAADNSLDYIVNEWKTLDLTPLGLVRYLAFDFESSDTGAFGINTPTYFAMDNLTYSYLGVKEEENAISALYPNPASSTLNIKGEAGTVRIFNAAGSLVMTERTSGNGSFSVESLESGIYLLELSTATGASRTTFIKN